MKKYKAQVILVAGFLVCGALLSYRIYPKIIISSTENSKDAKHANSSVSTTVATVVNTNLPLLAQKVAIPTPASPNKAITVCLLDTAYIEMFYTFVESAHRAYVNNVLAVTVSKEASLKLNAGGHPNFFAGDFENGIKTESKFASVAFNKKVIWKFKVTLNLLQLGYSVLAMDMDNFFLSDPFKHFVCSDCDFEIQMDTPVYKENDVCIGIIYFRPTLKTTEFMKKLVDRLDHGPGKWDQAIFKQMTREWKNRLKFNYLPFETFPSGSMFNKRVTILNSYVPESNKIVIFHNNWVIGIAKKRYRAKELGIWLTDTNQYYSSPTRKYMTYANPVVQNAKEELAILTKAYSMAKFINRTLILPRFHNKDGKLGTLEALKGGEVFLKRNSIREHSFLKHRKVPDAVKRSISEAIFILSDNDKIKNPERTKNLYVFKTRTDKLTLSELTALNMIFSNKDVLKFHSLYFDVDFRN